MTECASLYERAQLSNPRCCKALISVQLLMTNVSTTKSWEGPRSMLLIYLLHLYQICTDSSRTFLQGRSCGQISWSLFGHGLIQQAAWANAFLQLQRSVKDNLMLLTWEKSMSVSYLQPRGTIASLCELRGTRESCFPCEPLMTVSQWSLHWKELEYPLTNRCLCP